MVKKKGKKQPAKSAPKEEPPAPRGDASKGVKGLKNLGNTCYVNSVIQCMHAAADFRESLPDGQASNAGGICASLGSVLRSLSGPGASLGPKALHSSFCNKFPWFKGHQQHDAHEFFCTLLGAVADEKAKEAKDAKEAKAKEEDPEDKAEESESEPPSGERAARLFQGQLCNTVLCWNCRKISTRVHPYFHLSLPVPETDMAGPGALGIPSQLLHAAQSTSPEGQCESKTPNPGKVDEASQTGDGECPGSVASGTPEATAVEKEGGSDEASAEEKDAEVATGTGKETGNEAAVEEGSATAEVSEALESEVPHEGEHADKTEGEGEENSSDGKEAAIGDEDASFEVCLRSENCRRPQWGWKWNMAAMAKEELLVSSIQPDSLLDSWNLKQLTLHRPDRVVRPGDRVISVQGESEHKQMLQILKKEPELTLIFQRTDASEFVQPAADGFPPEESEQDEKEEAADRQQRCVSFLEAWRQCQDQLPQELQGMYRCGAKEPEAVGAECTLQDCLRKFADLEAMEEDFYPSYECTDCAKAKEAAKAAESGASPCPELPPGPPGPPGPSGRRKAKMFATSKYWLCGTPQMLTLQLKRFNKKLQKIKTKVAMPATLDLAELAMTRDTAGKVQGHLKSECEKQELPCPEDTKYELFGVVQHHGSTMQGGHYTAYVNLGSSLEGDSWYFCNDAVVTKCGLQDALKAEAYVAFYRKVEQPSASEA